MLDRITLPYSPGGKQKELFRIKSRFLVAMVGRQWGKSHIEELKLAIRAVHKEGVYWWVSPVYSQAKVQFRRFLKYFKVLIKKPYRENINRSELYITLINDSYIFFKSADQPDNLKGDTLDGCVMDECGTIKETVWSEVIRPMLAVKNGWCDFIGTPKGKNWFGKMFLSPPEGFTTFHASSDTSPFFPKKEFEAIRQSTPEKIFRQEYLAEILDDDSEVFRGIKNCIYPTLSDPVPGRSYVAGIDLAKSVDFTVITIWDAESKSLVYFDRFNQLDWNFQEMRIRSAVDRYDASIIIDSTGVGEPIHDRLRSYNYAIEAVRFTNQVKENLIHSLAIAIEKAEIRFPEIPELIAELQLFALEVSDNGKRKYNAPSGYHDDIVISMALAVSRLDKYAGSFVFIGGNGARR